MCFSNKCKRCSSRCLKFFAFLLFLISVALMVASMVMFKPVDQKLESGKLSTKYNIDGNIIAAKMCKLGGVIGIFMSVLAYLTAANKVPYFAIPFALGSFGMAGVFTAVFVMTVSQEGADYFKD